MGWNIEFLNTQGIKGKKRQCWTLLKFKTYALQKDAINRMKRQGDSLLYSPVLQMDSTISGKRVERKVLT